MTRRIAFVNEKGGSAKTTLVANLAAYYALRRGRRVLALDFDPQGQLGKVLGVDVHGARRSAVDLRRLRRCSTPSRSTIAPATARRRRPARWCAPASRASTSSSPTRPWPSTRAGRRRRRPDGSPAPPPRRAAPRTRAYDFVLMDAPPSFSPLTLNVLRAADEVVIPVPLTYLALDGCAELLRTLRTVRTRFGHRDLRVSMVVPTFYRRTRLAHEMLERLKQQLPEGDLRDGARLPRAHRRGAVARPLDLRVRARRPRRPGPRGRGRGARGARRRRAAREAAP